MGGFPFWLRWEIRMCNRTPRRGVHRPVQTLVDSSICDAFRKAQMQANLSIASEELNFIPFPRFAKEPRKLHIRCVLLPSPNRIRFAGLRFGDGIIRMKITHKRRVFGRNFLGGYTFSPQMRKGFTLRPHRFLC